MNLKSLLAIAMIALFSVTLTSCGDESEDPTPTKTDLQKVQEAVAGSTWTLTYAEVNDGSYTYNADCNFTGIPAAIQQNLTDYTFNFATSGNGVSWSNNCFSQSETTTYSISQSGSVFTMLISGSLNLKLEFVNDVEDIEDTEITVKRLSPLAAGVTEVKLTFSAL